MSQQQSDPTLDFVAAFQDPSKWIKVENIPICIPHERTVKNSDGEEQTIVVTVEDLPMIANQLEERAAQYGVYPVMTYGHRQQTDPTFPEKDQPDIAGFTADHHFGYFGPSQVPAVLGTAYYKREEWDEAKKYPFRSMDYYPGTKKVTGVALLKRDPYLPLGMVTYAAPAMMGPTNGFLPSGGKQEPVGHNAWRSCMKHAMKQGPVTYAQRGDSHTGDQVFDKKNKTGQWIETTEELREEPEQVEYGLIRTGLHAASKTADAVGVLHPITGMLNSLRHGDMSGSNPITGQLNSAKRFLLGRSLLQKAPKSPVMNHSGLIPVMYWGYKPKSEPITINVKRLAPAAPSGPSIGAGASATPPKLGGVSGSASATPQAPKLGNTSQVGGKLGGSALGGAGGVIGGVAGAGAGGWAGGEIGDAVGGHTGRRIGNVVGGVAGALGGHALGTVAETAIGHSNTPMGYSNMPEPSGHQQWRGHMAHAISSHPKVKKGGPVGYDLTPPAAHTTVGTGIGAIGGGLIGGIAGGAVGHPVAGATLGAAAGGMAGAAAANRPEPAAKTTNVYKGVHEAPEKAQNGPVENANAKKSTMIGRGVDALSKSRVGRGLSSLASHTAKVDSAILSAPGKAIDAVSKSKVGKGLGRLQRGVSKVDSRILKSVGMQDDQPIILYALGSYRKK